MSEHSPDPSTQRLHLIFDRGAENASQAFSRWLGHNVSLQIGEVDRVGLAEAVDAMGPGETLVAACAMEVFGPLDGQLLLIFEDQAGLSLVDLLMRMPLGTSRSWGELEQSAARETANIVGCAYLNALAHHLPGAVGSLVPGPPLFRHEFVGSLLEFALQDQAVNSDELLLIRTRFRATSDLLEWSLVFVPSGASVVKLSQILSPRDLG